MSTSTTPWHSRTPFVEQVATQPDYVSRPAVQDDLAFIRHDTHLRQMLGVLSTFGTWSRYYRLEAFLDLARRLAAEPVGLGCNHALESDAFAHNPGDFELVFE